MSNQNQDISITDIALGLIVLLITLGIAYKYKLKDLLFHKNHSYTIHVKFDDVSGLTKGADVEIAGVVVGKVSNIQLQNEEGVYGVLVSMEIDKKVKIASQATSVKIANKIMGTNSIAITCGEIIDNKILKDGDIIDIPGDTALSVESLVNTVLSFLSPKNSS